MAKINITRLPNATEEYDASQFDQMIRLLEQIVFLLNTNFQQDLKEQAESETFSLANTFKSAMVDLTNTDLTTILTVPTADPGATPPVPPTTNVVKSILVCNDSGSTTLVDLEVLRSSATFELFKAKSVATNTTTELLSQPLVLQESDVLKAQANAANQVHIIVSFMEVTKGQL